MRVALDVLCLGPPRLTLGRQVLTLSPKAQALVCYLAVTGRPHSREELAGLLWSELPEAAARANLRTMLPGLRQALGGHLLVERDRLSLNPRLPIQLDLAQFLAGLNSASETDLAGLRAALKLYRGDFLAGLRLEGTSLFEDWVVGQRERYRLLAVQALHHLAAHHTEKREYGAATEALGRLLELEPWREDGHRQLMTLLAQSGQREAALAHYARCCRLLADELGVEPSPETTRLYQQIEAGQIAARPPPPPRHNLPAALTPLLGRGAELGQIGDLLQETSLRLLTLRGPGGVGKTRLALAAAAALVDQFADGVHLVSLASITDPGLVWPAVAQSLGLKPQAEALDSLKEHLRHQQLLLVLDNFEQVIPAAPGLSELLASGPGLKLLVTSRRLLNLYGEHSFLVPPPGGARPGPAARAGGSAREPGGGALL
jgi:DNA-binding SARP family transcriptional activator